jgi:hypothetical protein
MTIRGVCGLRERIVATEQECGSLNGKSLPNGKTKWSIRACGSLDMVCESPFTKLLPVRL